MERLIRLLRSWRKEERRTPLESREVFRAGVACLIVLVPVVALQLQRRTSVVLAQQQALRDDTLAIMEVALSVMSRASRDWGHWDDAYRFARGGNPDYERTYLATAAVFDAGAVMVMLRPDGSPLLSFARPRLTPTAEQALIRCLRANTPRLSQVNSIVRLACRTDRGALYLGAATPISDNSASAPAVGTLAMFDPLLKSEYRPAIRARLDSLREELLFVPRRRVAAADTGIEPILPPIHSAEGSVLAMRRPALLPIVGRGLLEDLPLLAAIPVLAISLRAITLLARRRRRIVQRQAERLANLRIRQACRELDLLLEGLLPHERGRGESSQLLGRLSLEASAMPIEIAPLLPEAGGSVHERELARVTSRFQRFLRSASSLALLDPLTQLPNRRYFIAQVTETAARHSRAGQHFALLFVDVDKFKVINDTYGHAVGDGVLVNVCQRLRQVLGSSDFMARYGGDELAVILDLSRFEDQSPEALNRAAREQAHAMVDSLIPPVQVGDLPIAVSLSIGITLVNPCERDIAAVIQRSDLAMYQAKRSRNSRIIGPDDVGQAPQLNSYQLFTDLIQAIRSRQLQIFFQPIVTASGALHGMEALARWHHPQRGWVSPILFLEMAEQHRQIQLLGHELIRLSLDGFQQLHLRHPDLRFYLNLSPNQLLAMDLADRLLAQLRARGLPAEQLTLELTEHSILEPHAAVRTNLEALRRAGVHLALDDFGTGYSSLVLLKTLRPDVVKIDKSFIQAISHDPDALHIITLIAALAPRLGLELIAEGIEDRAAVVRLEALGIQYFQGYEFGQPLPLQDWLELGGSANSSDSRAIV